MHSFSLFNNGRQIKNVIRVNKPVSATYRENDSKKQIRVKIDKTKANRNKNIFKAEKMFGNVFRIQTLMTNEENSYSNQ